MSDDKIDEVLNEASESVVDSKRRIVKYIVFWVAIVALFLVLNIAIRSLTAPQRDTAVGQSGYYSSGQPVANTVGGSSAVADSFGANGASGACGGNGSCCSSGSAQAAGVNSTATQSLDVYDRSGKVDLKKLESVAVAWYAKTFADSNVTAEVQDFGCHQQITIKKGNTVVKELSFRGGQLEVLQ